MHLILKSKHFHPGGAWLSTIQSNKILWETLEKAYIFGTTWWWVNTDRNVFFEWSILQSPKLTCSTPPGAKPCRSHQETLPPDGCMMFYWCKHLHKSQTFSQYCTCGTHSRRHTQTHVFTIKAYTWPFQKHLSPWWKWQHFGAAPAPHPQTGRPPNLRVPETRQQHPQIHF